MKKPWYQALVEFIKISVPVLAGGYAFLQFLGIDIKFITISVRVVIAILLIVFYTIIFLLLKFKKVKWLDKQGQLITLKSVKGLLPFLLLTIFFIWIHPIINRFSKNGTYKAENVRIVKPLFDSTDNRFKVIIMPFDKECEYLNTTYDIGKVIARRLQELNLKDTLNLDIRYLGDSISLSNFTSEKADSILKFHHGNQIIYGYYSLKSCEGGNSDKVCFNYRTNGIYASSIKRISKLDYKMVEVDGLESLRKGSGQEDIEYVIYSIAALVKINYRQYDQAISKYQKIKNYEDNEELLFQIGSCYISLGDDFNGIKVFEKIIQKNPYHENALKTLGFVYYINEKYDKALEYLHRAIALNGEDISTLNTLAGLSFNKRNYGAAKNYFLKILSIQPNSEYANLNLGRVFISEANYTEAQRFIMKAINLNPNNAEAWGELGVTHTNRNELEQSIFCYKNSIIIDSSSALIWSYLGKNYLEMKKIDSAKFCFERSLSRDSSILQTWLGLGKVYYLMHNKKEAFAHFNRTVLYDKNYQLGWYNLGVFYSDYEEYEKAEQCFMKVISIGTFFMYNEDLYKYLGLVHIKLRNFKAGIKDYEKVIQLNPKDAKTLYNISCLYSIQRDKEKALKSLASAIRLNYRFKREARYNFDFGWLWDDQDFRTLTDNPI